MNSLEVLVITVVLAQAEGFCGSRSLDAKLARAAVRTAEWLRNNKDEHGTYGEGHVNGFAFTALRLVGHSVHEGAEVLNAEIKKKGGLESIDGGPLAVYILGALATCRNPEKFYGLDLVTSLLSKVDNYPRVGFNHPFQYSLAIVALCTAGKDLGEKKYLNYIIENIPKQTDAAHASGDTLAMHIFALKCVKKFVKGEGKSTSLKLKIQDAAKNASEVLRNRQLQDPTFKENEVTAALSYQGLLAAEAAQTNCSETMQWLLSRQNPDGSFGNLGATIYVLPSLVGALPYDLQEIICPTNNTGAKEVSKMIRVCVTLKFNESHKYSNGRIIPPPVCVEVLNGTNAYEILKIAATRDGCYSFDAKKTMWGHSIYAICGIYRKPKEKFYWMIYINGQSAKVGIDSLRPANGSTLLFEFKQLSWRK